MAPSTIMLMPVVNAERGLARNTVAAAISCGVAMRPVGLRLIMLSKNAGALRFTLPQTPSSKNTVPGETTLQRTLAAAFARATPLAKWISAAFIAPYDDGWSAFTDDTDEMIRKAASPLASAALA